MTFPWEKPAQLPAVPIEDTVKAVQRDMAFMVTHTAVLVHSRHEALRMLINTPRGQIIPRGECEFLDGSTFELQDVGMPQPGAPTMSIKDLMVRIWDIAYDLGLELKT